MMIPLLSNRPSLGLALSSRKMRWMLKRTAFAVTRHGKNILHVWLPRDKDTGIRLRTDGEHVAEYEAREAAIYCHYNWTEFQQLGRDERAACVAQYRIHIAIE